MDLLIEEKWQTRWETEKLFESKPDPQREKMFVTFPFPYMNGPLHIGHAFTSTRVDVFARFKRMQGYDVLFPWAWHWTGQPIVAAAERLSKGDPAMVHEFLEIDRIPKEELSKFYDPHYMAQYYSDSSRIALKRLGLSIDWRREFHTTDLEPSFNRFVLWQYNKLRELGYVIKGTHPVVWCPRDQSPTGDHDRVAGEGVSWEEFTLVFFPILDGESNGALLPAATFRPETIFGVTNLWINPESEYVEIEVDKKNRWIVSEPTCIKLKDQLHTVELIRKLSGRSLIGKSAAYPLDNSRALPILPAKFVDPNNGTGVVYSVPAHAPMDYVALRDLKNDKATQIKFSLDPKKIDAIQPISLISIPGLGVFPAVELIEQMGIVDQNDSRIHEATNEIYKKEFHQGILNQNTAEFASKKVSEVKPLVILELRNNGLSDSLYDLPEKVVCRCLTQCTVKILEDQWFLKYSDPDWKRLAHQCVDQMAIYPESARQWFHDVIDWMKDWPCARRVGLGTPLPWAPGWIVETLSDSTIYMSFYTIKPLVKSLGIKPESLSDIFFDYVFLGKGDPQMIGKDTGIDPYDIRVMRNEFLYWYPVNLRNSAKELIPNHLTFFIFQHAAFYPKDLWPTAISANGMMMVDGLKMSKSKGNIITLSNALNEFGADTLRAALIGGAEGMDDLDWREKTARDLKAKIESLTTFIASLESSMDRSDSTKELPELWLENQIQKHIMSATVNLDAMKTKSAFQEIFFSYWNDVRYYLARTDRRPSWLIRYVVDEYVKLLSPFIPHTCEQINENRGISSLISNSRFPTLDQNRIHPESEICEDAISSLIADSQKIMKLLGTRVQRIHVYGAARWKYELTRIAIDARRKKEKMGETLERFFVAYPEVTKKDGAGALPKIDSLLNELGDDFAKDYEANFDKIDEMKTYSVSLEYLKRILGAEVILHHADEENSYDPKGKSKFSLPFKPALYLE
ncbi:MAG: leucine--tRNA ligase [Nitrososphaerales archaeon]